MNALILEHLQKTELWTDYLERMSVRIVDGEQTTTEAEAGALEDMLSMYSEVREMKRRLMGQGRMF